VLLTVTASTMIARFGLRDKVGCHRVVVEKCEEVSIEKVVELCSTEQLRAAVSTRSLRNRSHGAHIEALTQRLQSGRDAVDAGGVLDVGEAVHFLRCGLQSSRQFRGADMLLDHFV